MSYNIRNARGTDDRVDLGRIAAVIASFEPDIVALQEVDVGRTRSGAIDQATELAAQLGMSASFAPCVVHGDTEHYGIATLTKLPLLEKRQLMLPYQNHRRRSEPRCALVTRLVWEGGELDMVNTHLSIHAGERPAQVSAIMSDLDSDEVVIAGDFNCTPWSTPFKTMCCGLKPATRRARTWPSRLPLLPLDHILYRGPLDVVKSGVWKQGEAKRASDHLPVVAELAYAGQARGAA